MRKAMYGFIIVLAIVSLAFAENPFVTRDGDISLRAQNANVVLGGPATGSAAVPTFRSLVIADIPTITLAKVIDSSTRYQMLQSGGASNDPAYSTATWPATTTASQLLYSSATNTVGGLTSANSSVLVTDGAGAPSWGTVLPSIGDLTFLTGLSGGADIGIASAVAATAGQSLDITGQAGGTAATDADGQAGGAVSLTGGAGTVKNGSGTNDGSGGDLVLLGGAKGGATGAAVDGIVRVGSPTVGSTKATNLLAVGGGVEVDGAARFDGSLILGDAAADTVTVNGSVLSSTTIGADPALSADSITVGTTGVIFEGHSTDTIEGLLTAADVSGADKTWTLPNTTGTLITSGDTGTVTASMLQAAAADLGASDVNVNLSNTNGAFVTNVTVDGRVTAANVTLSGAATTTSGTGTAGTGVSVAETFPAVRTATLTFTLTGANDIDVADGGKTAGVKVFDFPQGHILILGAVVNVSVTATGTFNPSAADIYYIGVGTADGTQAADADLTATEQDIIAKQSLDTDSGGTLTHAVQARMATFEYAANVFDGHTTATALYVNVAVPDANATTATTHAVTGTLTVTYANLGDY